MSRLFLFTLLLTLSACSMFSEKDKRTELQNSLSPIQQDAYLIPDFIPESGGKIKGFKFISVEPRSICDDIGFQEMDVVTQIDDIMLDTPSAAMEFYNMLKENSFSKIWIIRKNKEMILNR